MKRDTSIWALILGSLPLLAPLAHSQEGTFLDPGDSRGIRQATADDLVNALSVVATMGDLITLVHFFTATPDESMVVGEAVLVDSTPLPDCTMPRIRQVEVFVHTPSSDQLDVTYFNADNPTQKQKAESMAGTVVPYQQQIWLNALDPTVDDWAIFSRRAGLQCLPTRFRFTFVGSHRYMEFREGEHAFDDTSKALLVQPAASQTPNPTKKDLKENKR